MGPRRFIAGTNFNGECALPGGGTHDIDRQELANGSGLTEAIESCSREDDGIVLTRRKFA
jgi:hypothetical protein